MKRPVIPIVIAVVIAMIAGLLVFVYARSAENRALQDQQPVSILQSSGLIPQGMTLGEANSSGLITSSEIAQALQPAGSIGEVTAQNSALAALGDVPAGQILMAASFGVSAPVNAPLEVPDGMLAVTVLLEAPAKVGTFLRPGSEIALFETATEPAATAGQDPVTRTKPILDRVQVLAIGDITAAQEDAATAESWQANLVTVVVDQVQAETLVHSVQTGGQLYAALLGGTTTLKPTAGVSDQDLG
jgi:pilus assembly protein CpaB